MPSKKVKRGSKLSDDDDSGAHKKQFTRDIKSMATRTLKHALAPSDLEQVMMRQYDGKSAQSIVEEEIERQGGHDYKLSVEFWTDFFHHLA